MFGQLAIIARLRDRLTVATVDGGNRQVLEILSGDAVYRRHIRHSRRSRSTPAGPG